MKKFTWIILFMWASLVFPSNALGQTHTVKTKVACIGNSVTFGYGLHDQAAENYPAQLGRLLGDGYEVRNFGRNGATLLSKGHNPYTKSEEFSKAQEYQPDIVIIDLGLNDKDPRNWPNYRDEFIPGYQKLEPLGPYPVRGVLWYQGESNAHNPYLYKLAFKDLTASWRRFRNEPGEKVIAVRYAWRPYSRGNLVNQENLPASTFVMQEDLAHF